MRIQAGRIDPSVANPRGEHRSRPGTATLDTLCKLAGRWLLLGIVLFSATANAQTTLSASPTAVAVGGTVTATWSGIAAPSTSNYLGLYAPGSSSQLAYRFLNGAASGSLPFILPTSMAQGTYELRLLVNNSVVAISNSFTVGPPVSVSGTVTASGEVLAGVSFAASNGGTCTVSNASGQYSCTVLQGWSGSVTPSFSNFSLTPSSRDYSGVAANVSAQDYTASSTTQLSASPTAVAVGGTVTATWSGIAAPSPSNYMALFVPGASGYLSYRYTNGAASGSVPYTLPTAMAQGTYQLRLFAPNSALLAISNSFTVGPPVSVSGTVTASGAVLAGVSFTATNGGTCTASNASGQYSCTVLQGWSGSVTPSFSGFSLTPASRDYSGVSANLSAQDYTASSTTQLSAGPTAVAVGGTLTATWSGIAAPSTSNYLALFVPGAAGYLSYRYTNGAASGSVPYTLPTAMAQGTYQLRLFAPNSALLAISNSFTVGPPVSVSGTVTASGAALAGASFTASNGGTCTSSNASGQYSCTVLQGWSGSVTPSFSGFSLTPASRDYSGVSANLSAQDYTASSTTQLSASPTAVAVGGTVTATWSGIAAPSTSNYLALFVPGASGYLSYRYTTGTASGSVPYVMPTSMAQGTYQLRLFVNNALVAISNSFTVGPPVSVSGTVTAGGAALAGVSFTASNGGTCTASNASGQYSCTVLQGWSGSVTPSLGGYSFVPASRDYSGVSASLTAQNYAAGYQVSGTVTAGGAAVAGVTFTASNGGACTASDASGQYSCTVLQGWSGSVTPSLGGYSFVPASRDYSGVSAHQSAQNYAANPPPLLSGTVTAGGSPFAGVSFAATNGGTCTPSNASGQYSCTVPQGWSGSVTPSLGGYVFNPVSRTYSNATVNQSAQDYAATPTYELSGTVTAGGSPLAGVAFTANNGGACTTSNASGQYSCIVLQGWSGSVTPSLGGYTFTPVSRGYSGVAANQSAQDYAAAPAFQLSGTVAAGGTPTVGVAFTATNGGTCTSSNASGQYSCNVPQGWSGSVTPSLSGHSFTPALREYSNVTDNQAAQDFAAVNAAPTTVFYIHPDHLNTPRMIANQTGATVWKWDQQEPFGSTPPNDNPSGLGAFEFPLRFPGQYFDRETSLAYNYFRDYDPATGRYVQPDPLGVLTNGELTPTMGLNHLYAYVTNGPLSFTDPLGLFKYNAPPPKTVPVPKPVEAKVVCLENCLGIQLVITGGAEQKDHSPGSKHYTGQAVDFGFYSNPGIRSRSKEFFCCALQCGFDFGQTEGGRGPHYHLQTVPGLGVPRIPGDACMCKP